ncbi:hypothetical protein RJT34_21995 [Clitoria ternatea]|uniref:TIR domain-containing protein n=1 Tax=Clitoria ternatea TaxID=43366 RepID=A0AAN9IVQ0_CLITE
MPSPSNSKSKLQWIYDVFINFRGEDTRENFVSHLYSALSNAGVNTFLDDDKLEKGQDLRAELLQAIEGSQICIVVFSPKYIESSWCLDELVKIMECHTFRGQVVFPIFCRVNPGFLRDLQDISFEEYYKENEIDSMRVRLWKKALTQAANLAGWDVRKCSSESYVLKEIVGEVLKKLDRTYLSITEFPVGLESRVQKRSRLWAYEEALTVLKEQSGTKAIEGLALKLQGTNKAFFNSKTFEKMKRLRLLQLDHVQVVGDYEYLPKHLRWVCWQGFHLNYVPNSFSQENVVAIDLKHSNLKIVWKESQLLERLKFLNLSHSKYLTKSPDFSKLPNLEKLILKDCPNLSEVHQSIGDLSNLLVINLKDCTSLANLPLVIYKLKSLKALIISGCSKINKLEENIVQLESLTTLFADNSGVKQVPFSIIRSKKIGYISLCGYEGLACDVFPSLIWSWMSPTTGLMPYTQQFGSMSSSIVSMDIHENNLTGLLSNLGELSRLRGIWVQCDSKFQLTPELRRILDDFCNAKFIELESTSYLQQFSENTMGSELINLGSNKEVIKTLNENINEELKTSDSNDFFLPGDNYPYWLAYISGGHSIRFQVPEDSDCSIQGMTLCVIYSSTPQSMVAECLSSVFIINYTKCTIGIYKQDTIKSFNDEDWQGVKSNLGPAEDVEIFLAFGHGLTVIMTAVYLIYGESITMRMEPPIMEEMESSPKVNVQQSPNVNFEQSRKPMKNIITKFIKKLGECIR